MFTTEVFFFSTWAYIEIQVSFCYFFLVNSSVLSQAAGLTPSIHNISCNQVQTGTLTPKIFFQSHGKYHLNNCDIIDWHISALTVPNPILKARSITQHCQSVLEETKLTIVTYIYVMNILCTYVSINEETTYRIMKGIKVSITNCWNTDLTDCRLCKAVHPYRNKDARKEILLPDPLKNKKLKRFFPEWVVVLDVYRYIQNKD
jgi:hypothetical protein